MRRTVIGIVVGLIILLAVVWHLPESREASSRKEYTAGLQWYQVELDGANYRLEFSLPEGKWHGAYRLDGIAGLGFDQEARTLAVAIAPLTDFASELDDMREIAEHAPHGAELVIIVPGRRAELHGRADAEDGTLLRSRMVTILPDATIPIGVSILDQSPFSEGAEPDLEDMISSIRIIRE